MEIDYELIGKRIREERISQNLSQQTLAEISNISPTNISHIERGATKLWYYVKISDYINMRNLINCY